MSSHNKNDQVLAGVSATHEGDFNCSPASDYIDRLARLIASGGAPIPNDINRETKLELLRKVNQLRRARLTSYIADVIARDIFESRRKEN